ncbi:MAG: DUF6788 family protein [Opitutaceae bacterium]|jgi:cyclopropane fatty-acyl-phospholipid synthase-like methyltransferase
MKPKKTFSQADALKHYEHLKTTLSSTGWISEGYVQDRGPGAGGPCFQWTRKVKGKTVSVALSKEQYEWLKAAIENWKQVQSALKEMQRLSRLVLFETVPGVPRRKPLTKRAMGLI